MNIDVGYGLIFKYGLPNQKSIKSTTNVIEHKCSNIECGKISRSNYCPECGSKIEQIVTVKNKKFNNYLEIFKDRYSQITGNAFINDFRIMISDDNFIIPLTYGCESHIINEGNGDYYSGDGEEEAFVSLDVLSKDFVIGLISPTLSKILESLPEEVSWKLTIYAKENP